jgi:hypothetical protein
MLNVIQRNRKHVRTEMRGPLRISLQSCTQSSNSSATMSSVVSEEHTRRLDRARRQYENLLIHAGEVLIDKEAGLNETFASEVPDFPMHRGTALWNSATGRMNTCLVAAVDVRFQSPAARSVRHSAIDDSFNDDMSQLGMDKDSIIFSLQVCVNRRRNSSVLPCNLL